MTTTAALRHLRARQPRRLIAAAPVAAAEAAALLQTEADEVVLISAPRRFGSVGSFYRSFTQVSEEEAMALLSTANGKGVTV